MGAEVASPLAQRESVTVRGESTSVSKTEKDGIEWHLAGVASGFLGRGVILFWDTQRPSFGRRGLV